LPQGHAVTENSIALYYFLTMKAFNFFALAMLMSSIVCAQTDTTKNSNEPYYVVIGAFSIQKNAARFTRQAPKYKLSAKAEMNYNRNLYYVHVLITDDRTRAIDEALALRARPDSVFSDAWVYHGSFKKSEQGEVINGRDLNPAAEQAKTIAATKTQNTPEASAEEKEGTKLFIFKISRLDDNADVTGDVLVVDVDLARKIGTFDGNKTVNVPEPKGKSGKITMTATVFGYRRIQHDLNYLDPAGDSIEIQDSTIVVPFQLVRLQKGDVAVMYDVYFFKDAAIMRPESRFEVGSLLDMMKENPKYKIKIHGHTNGKASGKIITLKEGETNYFSVNGTKEGFGSAKNLSKERAQVLKTYLMNNGIDEKRLLIKAWGGKKPIYDKLSPQAQSNVRVEIEILEN
jgi:outer membrane protein OmpA-like peptidoglycan-associated protein